jgi:hypothetical protein
MPHLRQTSRTWETLYDEQYNDLGWRMSIGKVYDPEDIIGMLE